MSRDPFEGGEAEGPSRLSPWDQWLKVGIGTVSIMVLLFAIYWPVLARGQFIWHDDSIVTDNRFVTSPNGLLHVWFSSNASDYFPLTFSVLWCEWQMWGANPVWFHFMSILLHGLSAVLLWRILRRLEIPAAIWAALLFALHPVNIESVGWIAERKNTLSMVFYLSSIYCFLRFDSEKGRWLLSSLVAFVLALLSNAAVVTLPIVLLACLWWRHRRITRTDEFHLLPFFAISAVSGTMTLWFQNFRATGLEIVNNNSFLERIAIAGRAVWFYLWKGLVPVGLNFVYPRWEMKASSIASYLPCAALVLMLGLFWVSRRGWGRAALFALVCFISGLLPMLGFFNDYLQNYSFVADHWQYFALIAVCATIAGGLGFVLQRWKILEEKNLWKVFVPLLVVMCGLSFHRVKSFITSEVLWQDVLAKNPNAWLAHNNLGTIAGQRGLLMEAVNHFEQATQIKPDYADAWSNWGNALEQQSDIAGAIVKYETALSYKADFPKAHLKLAGILFERSRYADAAEHLQAATAAFPDDPSIRFKLGKALLQLGRDGEAIVPLEEAVRLAPKDASAHNLLGFALSKAGRWQEAQRHLLLALKDKDERPSAHQNLGNLNLSRRKVAEAIEHFQKALELNPKLMGARMNLAWLFSTEADAERRNGKEAVRISLELAQETRFENPQVLSILSAAYAETGNFAQATETARKAIALCTTNDFSQLKRDLEKHLQSYLSGQPVREYHSKNGASTGSK